MYLKKLILPGVGVSSEGICDHRVGLLWDNFNDHSCPPVKQFCKSHDFLDVEIMGGGLTPQGQPLEKAVNKVFNGYLHKIYDLYSLTDTFNSKNGAPISTTRQLISTCIIESQEKVLEDLVRKSWTACGYIPEDEINASNEDAIILYSEVKVGNMVEKRFGEYDCTNFEDEGAVGTDHFYPSDAEGDDENKEMFSKFDQTLCNFTIRYLFEIVYNLVLVMSTVSGDNQG